MYSHAFNDGSVGAGDADSAQNLACFRCDYASSDFDARHSGTFSIVYELPFGRGKKYLNTGHTIDLLAGGWSLNSLLSARAGLPVNVTLSRSSNELVDANNVGQRPDRVPGVPLYLPGRSISHWINPNAFHLPEIGTWGNAGKNLITGPALWQNDSAVEKSFRIIECNSVSFRAEAFNIFNRAQYGQPASSLIITTAKDGSRSITAPASFGTITSTVNSAGLVGTGTPRVLEFGLRINYWAPALEQVRAPRFNLAASSYSAAISMEIDTLRSSELFWLEKLRFLNKSASCTSSQTFTVESVVTIGSKASTMLIGWLRGFSAYLEDRLPQKDNSQGHLGPNKIHGIFDRRLLYNKSYAEFNFVRNEFDGVCRRLRREVVRRQQSSPGAAAFPL